LAVTSSRCTAVGAVVPSRRHAQDGRSCGLRRCLECTAPRFNPRALRADVWHGPRAACRLVVRNSVKVKLFERDGGPRRSPCGARSWCGCHGSRGRCGAGCRGRNRGDLGRLLPPGQRQLPCGAEAQGRSGRLAVRERPGSRPPADAELSRAVRGAREGLMRATADWRIRQSGTASSRRPQTKTLS
jgi:hypothetical protein